MSLLKKFTVALTVYHLVLGVWLNCPLWELVERSELLARGHEIFFIHYVHIKAWIIIVNILINAFSILNMNFFWRVNKRLTITRVQSIEK